MIREVLVATVIAALAGWAAKELGLPLPWMIGPLLVIGALSFTGIRMVMPDKARDLMIAVIGVLLGGAFGPDVFDDAAKWPVTLALVLISTAMMALAGYSLLRWAFKFDRPTALYSGAPGGLSQMIAQSAEAGADLRVVSVTHTVRMVLIVLTVPPLIFVFYQGGSDAAFSRNSAFDAFEALLLMACVVAFPVARKLRIPSAPLVGPMLASALLHFFEIVVTDPPEVTIAAAQLVLATSVALRFGGTPRSLLLRYFFSAALLTVLLVFISVASAAFAAFLTGLPFSLLLLSFIPGGTSEIVIVAIALGQDPAFVSMHHLLRMVLILILAPLALKPH